MNVNLINVRIMEPVLMGSICTLVDVLKASIKEFVLWVSFLQWYLIHDKGERKHTISRNILCIFFGKLLGYISINSTRKHSFCNDKNNIVSCLLANRYKWMWIWSMWDEWNLYWRDQYVLLWMGWRLQWKYLFYE